MEPLLSVETKKIGIDNTKENKYNLNNGIKISLEVDCMNTNVTISPDGLHYLSIYTYINQEEYNEIKQQRNKNSFLLKDCYDSLSEAQYQANLKEVNIGLLTFVHLKVNMTNTVFDFLSTEDVNKLEDFYNTYKNEIQQKYKELKNNKMDLDTLTVLWFSEISNIPIGIIRNIKKVKSEKHNLKCVSQRKIVTYSIIDKNIIAGYEAMI